MQLRIFALFFLLATWLPRPVLAISLDEYIESSHSSLSFVNGLSVLIDPIPDFNPDKLIAASFKVMSLDEGKPKDWKVLEHKRATIQGGEYFLIRYLAFSKEHLLVVNLSPGTEGKWSVKGAP